MAHDFLMRLFFLEAKPEKLGEFAQVGLDNFQQSQNLEAGTLFMVSGNKQGQPTSKVVFEIYAHQKAYEEHVASGHFQRFAEFAREGFSDRQVIGLQPEVLLEKASKKTYLTGQAPHLRLARLEVKAQDTPVFKEIVAEEMQAALEKETGVLALLAGRDQAAPTVWYFFEVYADEEAYNHHRLTPHFQTYLERTAELVQDKDLLVFGDGRLISKGFLQE